MRCDLSVQEHSLKRVEFLFTIDWGLVFAFSHKRLLFLLALFPALITMIGEYVLYVSPLAPKQVFLVIVLLMAANAWLIQAVVIACVQIARGDEAHFFDLFTQGLRHLPKVFFSYVCLNLIVFSMAADGSALLILPILPLLMFFVWAPVFCAAEVMVLDTESSKE